MSDPIVEIGDGKLRGKITKNSKDEPIYTFLGIPYGKPPLGDLKFKAPEAVDGWEGIRDATEDGSHSCQLDHFTSSFGGSEDCLYLNVFSKNLSAKNLKPVLVFIHGGGFYEGSNSSKVFSPAFLMREDIVFVSINYRLGILGFLRLSDTSLGVPGNAGMKDQVLALKWIRTNIEKFGGDPNNVTISGESAGSTSVSYLILSPTAKGLFHKAIMQSGTVLNQWAYLKPKYLDILKHLNANCENEQEILYLLKETPVEELVKAQNALEFVDEQFTVFAPCVEKPNETAFLTRSPIEVIVSGDYNKVPMMIGYDSNEGLVAFALSKMIENFNKGNYDLFIPFQVYCSGDLRLKEEIREKITKFYGNDKYRGNKILACTDSLFETPIIGYIQNMVRTSTEPIYYWIFDLVASRNFFRQSFNVGNEHSGASHADELGYLFDVEVMKCIPIVPGGIEDIAICRLTKLFVNFAKYGNPTPNQNELRISWKPVTTENLNYLHFSEELSMKTNSETDRFKFWKEVFQAHDDTKNFIP